MELIINTDGLQWSRKKFTGQDGRLLRVVKDFGVAEGRVHQYKPGAIFCDGDDLSDAETAMVSKAEKAFGAKGANAVIHDRRYTGEGDLVQATGRVVRVEAVPATSP